MMDRHTIEGYEFIDGTATVPDKGDHVQKRWRGADVKVVRTTDSGE